MFNQTTNTREKHASIKTQNKMKIIHKIWRKKKCTTPNDYDRRKWQENIVCFAFHIVNGIMWYHFPSRFTPNPFVDCLLHCWLSLLFLCDCLLYADVVAWNEFKWQNIYGQGKNRWWKKKTRKKWKIFENEWTNVMSYWMKDVKTIKKNKMMVMGKMPAYLKEKQCKMYEFKNYYRRCKLP